MSVARSLFGVRLTAAMEKLERDRAEQQEAMGFAVQTLPNYEKHVYVLLDREIRRAVRRELSKRLRRGVVFSHLPRLAKCLPELAGLPQAKRSELLQTTVGELVAEATDHLMSAMNNGPLSLPLVVAESVARSLHANAGVLDMQCRMPPPAAEPRKKAKPLTVIERRAKEVERKLRNWKRKQTLAKTKVAALRKKSTYYKKKGAV